MTWRSYHEKPGFEMGCKRQRFSITTHEDSRGGVECWASISKLALLIENSQNHMKEKVLRAWSNLIIFAGD